MQINIQRIEENDTDFQDIKSSHVFYDQMTSWPWILWPAKSWWIFHILPNITAHSVTLNSILKLVNVYSFKPLPHGRTIKSECGHLRKLNTHTHPQSVYIRIKDDMCPMLFIALWIFVNKTRWFLTCNTGWVPGRWRCSCCKRCPCFSPHVGTSLQSSWVWKTCAGPQRLPKDGWLSAYDLSNPSSHSQTDLWAATAWVKISIYWI